MPDLLAEIKLRERNATPPPWTAREKCDGPYFRYAPDGERINETGFHVREIDKLGNHESGAMTEADAVFCAHARRDVPYLLARLEAAERYVTEDILYHLAQRDGERVTMERSERARDDAFSEWHAIEKGEGQ